MKLYLSGPMSDYAAYNAPAFETAEKILQELGHETVNPIRIAEELNRRSEQPDYDDYLSEDMRQIKLCDGVVFLEFWEGSTGCKMEMLFARRMDILTFSLRENQLHSLDVNICITEIPVK